jgi:hypothetical protein
VFRRCLPAYTNRVWFEACYGAGFPERFWVRLSLCSPASCLSCDANCEVRTVVRPRCVLRLSLRPVADSRRRIQKSRAGVGLREIVHPERIGIKSSRHGRFLPPEIRCTRRQGVHSRPIQTPAQGTKATRTKRRLNEAGSTTRYSFEWMVVARRRGPSSLVVRSPDKEKPLLRSFQRRARS